ncbi:MAG: N-acetylmuramoyl-L-alanine amidase [Ignavibacteriales bacterium]|nr:N-acetylmuramoyl-L-alanine amidase [Ignavibacteriales bacterium]
MIKFSPKIIFLFLLTPLIAANAQRMLKISVDNKGEEAVLSYISRMGNVYVSGKEMAALLSANHYFNKDAAKLEIKFAAAALKFTAKNQFVITTKKSDNSQIIYQLPVSTLLINDDVFIPLVYCADYLSAACGTKIIFDSKAKNIKITKEPFDEDALFQIPIADTNIKPEPKNPEIKTGESLSVSKYDIYGIDVEEKSNGTLIRLKSSKKINIPRHSINNNVLYIFLPGASVTPEVVKNFKAAGFVKDIKRTVIAQKNYQLEFTIAGEYSTTQAFKDTESNDVLITIHNKVFTKTHEDDADPTSKWKFDVVVIDAGHGGKDPGAIGITGVKEKDLNLGIALKLGKLIEQDMSDVKIIYTRNTDNFVELYKRGKIANEADGKLFISIHCNSLPKKGSEHRGFEVYLLRPGRTQDAIEIAEFENSVIKYEENPNRYQKLTDENFILVSMAHSQYMRFSEKFSDMLNQEWKKSVEIPSLGIKQAGFYVLVGASMPSVLIETGFLSNRKDEEHLASKEGQAEVAHSIFNSIKKYKEFYDREIAISSENKK